VDISRHLNRPPEKPKETFFGIIAKAAGFVKKKREREELSLWKMGPFKGKNGFQSFINPQAENPGFSINKVVTADMEWVAEAYMETDYSKLPKKIFIDPLLKFLHFF